MLAEDNAMIAMMIEDDLRDAGFLVEGPFSTCASALAWLVHRSPEAAVLDIALTDGPCTELSTALRERGVPFVVHSGYGSSSKASAEFQGAPWVTKPSDRGALIDAINAILAPEAAHG